MKKYFSLFISLMVLGAASCSPIYKTAYNFTPPSSHEGLMCVDHCMGMKTLCEQTCEAKDAKCEYESERDARREYDRYVDSRVKKGRELKKDKYYFENLHSCSPTSCKDNCAADYKSCYSSCGGNVTSSRECTAFCN